MGDSGEKQHGTFWGRWRANFLTGIVVIAPLYLTVWLIWSFVSIVDYKVERLLPTGYNLTDYLNFPGYGLAIFVVFTSVIGALAKNLFAAQLIGWGERMLDRLPIIRSIYNAIKQIAETVLVQSKSSFERACLVEYPRRGIWAVAFISTATRGELVEKAGQTDMVSVFLPTTPNPTSGFLLFVPREDVIELDMSVEEAAKLIISAGLVSPAEVGARQTPLPPIPAAAE
ncbi:DUF502 domain-containing protein [Rubrimonas cliftonensis]|uniref:Uncharacterized membrane protein n=1 Tax=Rubrimonas cliftonensis TaxID=89524 RepID=A0A1H3W353_9RHOB|nr:DUF502 domain-containing protein [Rubrimonas cliftonensis]SDZ81493.1 Uncharacterized membrane protein [Rubrimonas cliftonensis]